MININDVERMQHYAMHGRCCGQKAAGEFLCKTFVAFAV